MPTERARIKVISPSAHSGGEIAVLDGVVGAGFQGPPRIGEVDGGR